MEKLKASDVIDIDDRFIDMVAEKVADKIDDPGQYITIAQVAEIVPISLETVRRHVRSKKLPAKKVGKLYLIKKTDLKNYLEK